MSATRFDPRYSSRYECKAVLAGNGPSKTLPVARSTAWMRCSAGRWPRRTIDSLDALAAFVRAAAQGAYTASPLYRHN